MAKKQNCQGAEEGGGVTTRALDTLHSSDLERRNASMARLEQLGWMFRLRSNHWGVYHLEHDHGCTHWFGCEKDSLDRAVKYASAVQLQRETKGSKR